MSNLPVVTAPTYLGKTLILPNAPMATWGTRTRGMAEVPPMLPILDWEEAREGNQGENKWEMSAAHTMCLSVCASERKRERGDEKEREKERRDESEKEEGGWGMDGNREFSNASVSTSVNVPPARSASESVPLCALFWSISNSSAICWTLCEINKNQSICKNITLTIFLVVSRFGTRPVNQ